MEGNNDLENVDVSICFAKDVAFSFSLSRQLIEAAEG